MTPSQVVQLQALKLKATIEGNQPSLIDSVLNNPANQEALKKDFRNVCALLHARQFEQLESICELLSLSKREVITLALSDFLPRARAIVSEIDPFEHESHVDAAIEAAQQEGQ